MPEKVSILDRMTARQLLEWQRAWREVMRPRCVNFHAPIEADRCLKCGKTMEEIDAKIKLPRG